MDINRREFMKKIGKYSLIPLLPSFLNCGGGSSDSTPSPKEPTLSYTPKVNSPPYHKAKYFTEKGVSDQLGVVWANCYDEKKAYNVRLINQDSGKNLSGLETTFYKEDIYGTKVFHIIDPKKEYMPNIAVPHGLDIASSQLRAVNYEWPWNYVDMYSKGLFDEVKGIIINEIDDSLPSWNSENVDALPGFVYLGDWSFNDLKTLNTNLKRGSLVLTVIPPTSAIGATAYGVLSKTGAVIDGLGVVFDTIGVDKDTEYPIYFPVGDPSSLILSLARKNRSSSEDIKHFLPTDIGNSWTFKSGLIEKTMEVEGTKNINGRDLLVIKGTDGIKEYFGFYGNSFYQYGISDPAVGDIFFDPAIELGNNNISIGKSYHTSSKIIAKEHPEISGSADETITFIDRETIVLSDQTPFGDCFKTREDFGIYLYKDGESVSLNETAYHWYAKNVGKVKGIFRGQTAELVDAKINNLNKRTMASALSLESLLQSNPFSQRVVDGVKKLI